MKAAIYLRVSKQRGQETANQEPDCIQYAKAQGLDYDIFRENESTRKTRPVKEKVLESIRRGEYTGIIMWKLDRWGRSVAELSTEMLEFIEHKWLYVSVRDNIDLSGAGGRFYAHILAAFAELERDIIRERTLAGLERAKAAGKRLGRPSGSRDKGPRRRSGYWARWAGPAGTKQSPPVKPD